jgi:hypothetical protein
MKRYRTRKAKPGELIAYYGKAERWDAPGICTAYGGSGASRADSCLLMTALTINIAEFIKHGSNDQYWPFRSLLEELEVRGYDLATLRFSIQRKAADSEETEWE